MADVLLTIAICIIQLALGIMGVRVSLRPPLPKHHLRWIFVFVAIGLLGVGLTAYMTARSGKAAEKASTDIDSLKQKLAHIHIRPIIGLYGVDDPTRLPKNWTPFMAGRPASFRVNYQNSSDNSNGEQVAPYGYLIPATTTPNLADEFSKVRSKFSAGWRGEQLAPQDGRFFSARSHILSREESKQIKQGSMTVFLVAVIRFSDSTGDYEQDVCDWLQPHSLDVWHGCGPEYESEKKLK